MNINTVSDALEELIKIKKQIRTVIIGKGIDVPTNTPFSEYPDKIEKIYRDYSKRN